MKIDFEKLKKHTEYTLEYKLDGETIFTIEPPMKSKTRFLQIISKKEENTEKFNEFLCDLVVGSHDGEINPKDIETLKAVISDNSSQFLNDTMIGFGMTTEEEINKKKQEIEARLLEKNLE